MGRVYTDEERRKAEELAHALEHKIAIYFPEPPQDERIREVASIKKELEDMGFLVTWQLGLDVSTLRVTCVVTLWVPQELH